MVPVIDIRYLHCDQLLGTARMDGNRVVEVGLGRTHLQGYCESLQHLVSIVADDVNTHHTFFAAGTDQLYGCC